MEADFRRLSGEQGSTWGAVLTELLFSALSSVSPLSIAGLAIGIADADAASAAEAWVRQVQRLEEAITKSEEGFRAEARGHAERSLEEVAEIVRRFRRERAELDVLLRAGGNGR